MICDSIMELGASIEADSQWVTATCKNTSLRISVCLCVLLRVYNRCWIGLVTIHVSNIFEI